MKSTLSERFTRFSNNLRRSLRAPSSSSSGSPETGAGGECWGQSLSVVHKATFSWEIHEIKTHLEANKLDATYPFIKSPIFSPSTEPNLKIAFKLYPRGLCKETDTYVGLQFEIVSVPKESALLYYTVGLMDNKQKKRYIINESHEYKEKSTQRLAKFVPLADLVTNSRELLAGNKLIIRWEMVAYTDQIEVSGSTCSDLSSTVAQGEAQLGVDLSAVLFTDPSGLADFWFTFGEKELPVHKVLLSARSPVFASMFRREVTEKKGNRSEIPEGIDVGVFREMLRYIYTGRVSSLKKCTVQLLAVAEKYQIGSLKELVEAVLSQSLDVESVAATLLEAEVHKGAYLKGRCVDFIVRHAGEVIETKGWKMLTKRAPELAMPIFNRQHSVQQQTTALITGGN